MKETKIITLKNRKHSYSITPQKVDGENVLFFECSDAGISQCFYPEDIQELLDPSSTMILSNLTKFRFSNRRKVLLYVVSFLIL